MDGNQYRRFLIHHHKLFIFSLVNIRQIVIVLTLMAVTSCSNNKSHSFKDSEGYNRADSLVSAIGDERDFPRLLTVTDSLERAGSDRSASRRRFQRACRGRPGS